MARSCRNEALRLQGSLLSAHHPHRAGEKAIDVECVQIDLFKGEQHGEAFRRSTRSVRSPAWNWTMVR